MADILKAVLRIYLHASLRYASSPLRPFAGAPHLDSEMWDKYPQNSTISTPNRSKSLRLSAVTTIVLCSSAFTQALNGDE
jgi:hypothetical protein